MHKTIELKIVTPDRVLLQETVEAVSIPTVEGEITVLPEHLPIIAAMKPGELRIKREGKESFFAVTRGVVEVDGKLITILVDAAEKAEDIDEKRAEEAKARARAIMSEKRTDEELFTNASAELERALSRIKIARRRSSHGSHTSINQ